MAAERIDTHGHLGENWAPLADKALDGRFASTMELIDSHVAAEGCRVLHGIDSGAFIRPDSPPDLFRKAAELRAKGSWAGLSPHIS